MAQKFLRYLVIGIVVALVVPVFCPAQAEKPPTHQLTGTVIYLDKTEIRILYEIKNNVHFVSGFKLTDSTQIKGTLEIGALVTVIFIKERLNREVFRRLALEVKVVQTPVPEEAAQPVY